MNVKKIIILELIFLFSICIIFHNIHSIDINGGIIDPSEGSWGWMGDSIDHSVSKGIIDYSVIESGIWKCKPFGTDWICVSDDERIGSYLVCNYKLNDLWNCDYKGNDIEITKDMLPNRLSKLNKSKREVQKSMAGGDKGEDYGGETLDCITTKDPKCDNGSEVVSDKVCIYNVGSADKNLRLDVYFISRYGGRQKLTYNLKGERKELMFQLTRENIPFYMICHDAGTLIGNEEGAWGKDNLVDWLYIGRGEEKWGTEIQPEDILNEKLSNINSNINNLADNLLNLGINTTVDVNKTYYNIDKENVTSKWLLGLLFAMIGMMLFFDTFFNDRFVRYI